MGKKSTMFFTLPNNTVFKRYHFSTVCLKVNDDSYVHYDIWQGRFQIIKGVRRNFLIPNEYIFNK